MQHRYISMHDRCRSTRTSIRVQARNMIELSEHQIIDQIADRLAGIHPEVSPEAVTRVVQEEHARFNGRPVRDFVPLFVERYAKAELATSHRQSLSVRPIPRLMTGRADKSRPTHSWNGSPAGQPMRQHRWH